ncbi:hypothetical protein Ga0102493_111788 [Erythrobacter litoralis]|jgi:hypothetical protein|uniref:Uncharacterized protein n=1 Tax=Erythrobacter litoralis TaxID=39960 RepID=A0A074MHC0_9SPHN|nr:hypothetical protein [Erythrobacter litoralis]AOL22810.1 hypothetical protein Ga0102493_111788 [Erythrobacter litoralis]KEO92889.1 hypothetical protein EH32_13945 [Erythrobacter litoralis]MEE4338292.1 hypothetical protein [Erythrobacter sp.]
MNGAALAVAALIPLATGPAPQEEKALTIGLCGGGRITIPLGDGDTPERTCDPKACHAANCREKTKERPPRTRI